MASDNNQLAGRMVPARKLRPDEDTMVGKTFKHKDGDLKGMNDTVDYTIEENGKYSVIFKSGIKVPVLELYDTMVDTSVPSKIGGLTYDDEPSLDIDDIIPGKIKNPNNNQQHQINYVPPSEPAFGPEDYVGNLGGNVYQRPVNNQPKDPIHDLLRKKKKSNVPVKIEVELDLPSKDIYDMLVETFDGAYESIMNYLLNPEGMEYIKQRVKSALNTFYGVEEPIIEPIVEQKSEEPIVEQKSEELNVE